MSAHTAGLYKSLLIHAVGVAAVVLLTGGAREASRPVTIDFTIENQDCVSDTDEKRRQPRQPETPRPAAMPEPVQQQAASTAPPAPPQPAALPAAPTATQAPVVAQEAASPAVVSSAHTAMASPTLKSPGPPATVARSHEQNTQAAPSTSHGVKPTISPKEKYLSEQFAYIRDIVQKKAAYPAAARRFGWMGRVTVAFVVLADGGVKELRVMSSSGRDILDKSAVEAVKNAAPFPPPPVEAELVIPVAYSLQ